MLGRRLVKFLQISTGKIGRFWVAEVHQQTEQQVVQPVSLAYATYDPEGKIDKTSPIFILHGLFGSKQNWNTMARNLSLNTNRRVVAVDLRNHGESPHVNSNSYLDMAADMKALMSELNIQENKASFVGHSLGGRAAMTLLLMNPELARDLVVVDISPVGQLPHVTSYFGIYNSLKEIQMDNSLTLAEMRQKGFDELEKTIKNEGLRKFLLSNLVKEKDKFRWRVNLHAIALVYKQLVDMPDIGTSFDKPTLFLCGERSDYVPHEHHKGIYKQFPKARIEYFQGTGHLPHAERPEQFLRVVSEFFNKTYTVQ